MKHSKSIILFFFLSLPILGIAQVMPVSFFQSKAAAYIGAGSGNAIQFNSPNKHINGGTNPVLNITNSLTIELWINPSQSLGNSQWDRLVHRNWPNGYFFGGRAGSKNALAVVLSGDSNAAVSPNETVIPNIWQHVAFVYDAVAKTIVIYRNGVSVSNTAWNGTITGGANNKLTLSDEGEAFNGIMDEVRIWNIARSASQILSNYNRSVATNSSGLVAYYKFNEGSGNATADATGNGNNGSFVNSPIWAVPSTAPIN
jgi:hypothetical protein